VADLPTGTVTFLFTDIEGSTRLLHELGDAYTEVLADHRRVLRECFDRYEGVEVDTQGDAFFVAFTRASGALAAAAEGKAALEAGPIRVRMGLHTGEPLVTAEGYVGIDVHRAARIAAAGHGGQILVSQSARDLAGDAPLRDPGEHRLKDMTAPERIYQLGDDDFPPLKSLNQSNLPIQPTPLIGRERELGEVLELQRASRLLTLTGAGGSGKTRLALQAGAELVDQRKDGVWFVPLAGLTDAELVESTIASVVGAKDDLGRFLSSKRLLLVLDNLEQLLPAAAPVVAKLVEAPGVEVIATSRERLGVAAEQEYVVPTLVLDEAVALFSARARRLKPGFELTEDVAEIARRLEGLPLALELAAARIKLLTPKQILERLGQSLDLLVVGARDAPERHRTLRATIEWSHELLGDDERRLFMRLGVFPRSFDLDAASAIAAADIDTLQSLLDKSLLRQTIEGRFFYLETIREFAVERLKEQGNEQEFSGRHAEHYSSLTATLREGGGNPTPELQSSFELEQDNLRFALEHFLSAGPTETALEMVESLSTYWVLRGQLDEGERWTERALAKADQTPRALLAWVISTLGEFPRFRGDLAAAIPLKERALEMSREIGDLVGQAASNHDLADAWSHDGQYVRARQFALEALELRRQLGRPTGIAHALSSLFDIELFEGNYEEARRIGEEVLAIERDHAPQGADHAIALFALAECFRRQGDHRQAANLLRDALLVADGLGLRLNLPDMLFAAAGLVVRSDPQRAAVLVGAAEAIREESGFYLWDEAECARIVSTVRDLLDDSTLEEARAQGGDLGGNAALAVALESLD
jgi:predicted ATPase